MPRPLLLRMTNAGVYYNPEEALALERTNLPVGRFRFKTHEPIYWLVEMLDFREGRLRVAVRTNDIDETELAAFAEQRPRARLKELIFTTLDFRALAGDFSYYDRAAFAEWLPTESPLAGTYASTERVGEEVLRPEPAAPTVDRPVERTFAFEVRLPLRRFHFESGAAVTSYRGKASPVRQPLELRIANSFLLPEFEYVKPFFARILGSRKLSVRVFGRRRGQQLVTCTARCAELESIDESTIGVVRYQSIRRAVGRIEPPAAGPEVDKSLFTAAEVLAATDPELGNVFRPSDRELLDEFITDTGVRNRAQLGYLAGKLQHPTRGLRFTLRPQFGFVFSVAGETMDHYVWELLDSHATYLWSFERDSVALAQQERLLHEALTEIRDQGRSAYRHAAAGRTDYRLTVIRHPRINSNFVDGFPDWRVRLEEALI